jgi:hypothetical protein
MMKTMLGFAADATGSSEEAMTIAVRQIVFMGKQVFIGPLI